MARVLRPYTVVEFPEEIDRRTWVKEVEPGLEVLGLSGRSGEGGNGVTAELEAILLNNGTTGGTVLASILGSSLGLNMAQHAAVREIGISKQGSK